MKGLIGSSVGVVYAVVANLPRDICFKKRYTALLAVVPGPKEPGPDCFHKVLAPIVDDLLVCERGLEIVVPTIRYPLQVSCRVLFTAADLPAAKKMVGAVSYAHNKHPCHQCGITLRQVNEESGYDWDNLPRYSPTEMVEAAFEHQHASAERKAEIESQYGVRYLPLVQLVGFQHSYACPVDPLHNSFLGIGKSLINMLFDNNLLEGLHFEDSRRDIFTAVFEEANYPGHLGRIPARVTRQFATDKRGKAGSALKADQWKRIVQLLPLALFMGFRAEDSDNIPDEDLDKDEQEPPALPIPPPPPPPRRRGKKRRSDESEQTTNTPRRNRAEWYRLALLVTASLQVLHAHAISVTAAREAVQDLSIAAVGLLSLGQHLSINWHNSMHYAECVALYGPLTGFATWALERNNGTLSRVNHNGQERDVPTTLLRSWELEGGLCAMIANPAPDADEREIRALESLLSAPQYARGTLMMEEMRGVAADWRIRLPPPLQKGSLVDLNQRGAYEPLLEYMQAQYPNYGFVDMGDYLGDRPCLPVRSAGYRLYTHATYNGFK